ncbi:MAG: hypothetical protein JNM18_26400 [Planctomycetaceae bacterium]|nr:hypothetical protein [Planctomycetaceae bacterium]
MRTIRVLIAILLLMLPSWLFACPFCTTPEPTLAERREAADVVIIGEVTATTNDRQSCKIHRVLQGTDTLGGVEQVEISGKLAVGTLVILIGTKSGDELGWHVTSVDEASLAYFARSPSLRTAASERLGYFLPFLEHANATIAQDAYAEFGRAPYDAVAAVADKFPLDAFRRHLVDPAVSGDRKGFYGLALGLAPRDADRAENAKLLHRLICEPASDFRAGFDGMLGGYLLLTGETGLQQIEQRFLIPSNAARGDVLHVITALRFYHEYGKQIPAARLAQALGWLVERPEYAATVIVDLARWEAWRFQPQIAALWDHAGFAEPPIRRAIVGYLRACPTNESRAALADLRKRYPDEVTAAERVISALGGVR